MEVNQKFLNERIGGVDGFIDFLMRLKTDF